jgi:hypothetical protein
MGAPRKLSAISLLFTVFLLPIGAATLGTVIPITGGVSDLTLDDNRNVLYLVRSLPYDRIDIFSTTQRRVCRRTGTLWRRRCRGTETSCTWFATTQHR